MPPSASYPAPQVHAVGAQPAVVYVAAPAAAPDRAALAAPELSPKTPDQIVQSIRLLWSRGAGEAQIRLEPRAFGELTVSVRVEHGQVVARLQAESPAVREWLQNNHSMLRHGLAEQNLALERLDIAAPTRDAHESPARDGQRRQHDDAPAPRRPRRPDTNHEFDIVA
jgi:flagellar hook-length control protein FliK